MFEPAPAKVNLCLHVLGRRGDGYHLLDSLAVFGPAQDMLRLEGPGALSLRLEGKFAPGLITESDNLVLRAAHALAGAAGMAAPWGGLVLEKNLPVASGIGGGSADAAAALRLLNRAWGLEFPPERLRAIALPLGADIPVCVESRPARMGGVGEVVTAAPALPPVALLLVNPGEALATPAVFRARQGGFSGPAPLPPAWADATAMAANLARCGNDLQAAAISLCPAIATVLAAIGAQPGCLLARMSGSGATCFGLFATTAEAEAAASAMPAHWWSHAGPLYEPPA
jgi:4-diphosphocytidyl-2-C-methyl-D-erythritol kinase